MDDPEFKARLQRLRAVWYSKEQIDSFLGNRSPSGQENTGQVGTGSASTSKKNMGEGLTGELLISRGTNFASKDVNEAEHSGGQLVVANKSSLEDPTIKEDVGKEAPESFLFTPWKVVQAYTANFIGKTNRPKAEPYFKFMLSHVACDIFYLYDQTSADDMPYFFIPTDQFTEFLNYVNQKLKIQLTIPIGANGTIFALKFGHWGTRRPRYLGRASSNEAFNRITSMDQIPPPSTADFQRGAVAGRETLRRTLDRVVAFSRRRVDKKKSNAKRSEAERSRMAMMLEVQMYLGVRPPINAALPDSVDLNMPPIFSPPCPMAFVAIDIEALENVRNLITEVGISVLCTDQIKHAAPGHSGEGWWPMIRDEHLRVREYATLRNSRFVIGCPERFNFGQSQFPSNKDLTGVVESMVKGYSTFVKPDKTYGRRLIVLVGHDIQQDIDYLKSANLDILGICDKVVDSRRIHQHLRKLPDGYSLENVLRDLDIDFSNLHNAGNDAAYTLRSMIACGLRGIKQDIAGKEAAEDQSNQADANGSDENHDDLETRMERALHFDYVD